MAVTIIRNPEAFALTKGGRTTFLFQGSGRYATRGTPASSQLVITGGPISDGTRIDCSWNGRVTSIVAKTNPVAANEFPAGDGSAAYVDSLVDFFEHYFPFREDFTVSRDDLGSFHSIVLTAKKPGPQYNVTAPSGIPHLVVGNTVPGADPIIRTQYSVYVELWTKRSDETKFTRVQAFPIETDADGIARFDVGSLLHAQMDADWPQWSNGQPTLAPNSHLEYFVAYGESYAEPGQTQQVGRIETDIIRHAYFGGADYLHQGNSGFSIFSYVAPTTQASQDRALRLGTLTRFVRAEEPQFLTFLNARVDVPAVLLQVKLTFSDQSVAYYTTRYEATRWTIGQKITYAVGAQQLQLAAQIPDNSRLVEYSVRLCNTTATTFYSASYRFIPVSSFQPYLRTFAYLNSWGAVDTLLTYGKGSPELTRFYETASQYLPNNYDTQLGQEVQYNVALQQQYEVATGFRSEAEIRGLNDFYRSRYLFHMKASRALPIGIVSKSIKQQKDGETLFAHTFQFAYRWQDAFASEEEEPELQPEPLPPAAHTDPVVITQPVVVDSVDKTVPDVVRTIDLPRVDKWDRAFAWGNHALQGYLTQQTGSQLFRRKDQKVNYLTDLAGAPVIPKKFLEILHPIGKIVTDFADFDKNDFDPTEFETA